ncbi:MAG: cation diffusion facilitator family transporter [Xanthomonadaceae bacterium]|nr:cation diffusion facilitator family transporter [Xanthomonadaceae bacterium]MDP2184589.1 cation diffusion facilitator family transporter [Xanthomonadales bacterium]MDZ4114862.1 cation diffusion facilitator family transporter [Xanthomonadaceae bacterium]MDZ4378142.1 cation diffusion facilitator family transporter [Xanthomonadaceae bacterium]
MPGHDHNQHHGGHDHGASSTRAFALGTLINLAYTALEAGYGLATDSLALLSDALHNFGDVLGLALAWGAAILAQRRPTNEHSFGWRRATLLAPLANALILAVFSGALAWEAARRLSAPPDVPGLPVMIVAAIGVVINLASAWLFHARQDTDLNRRGAYLHLLADAAVSFAAVVAGLGMLKLGWFWLDPVLALLVGVVVAITAWSLMRESFAQVMDAVPAHIDREAVVDFLQSQDGVKQVHHVHIWALGADEVALTAHIVRPRVDDHDAFLDALVRALNERYAINHATLQFERGTACTHDQHDLAPHH